MRPNGSQLNGHGLDDASPTAALREAGSAAARHWCRITRAYRRFPDTDARSRPRGLPLAALPSRSSPVRRHAPRRRYAGGSPPPGRTRPRRRPRQSRPAGARADDAALAAATWANTGSGGAAADSAAATSRRARPWSREPGSTSTLSSSRPARPRPITTMPASPAKTRTSWRQRRARTMRGWSPGSISRTGTSAGAARSGTHASTTSRLPARRPVRSASHARTPGATGPLRFVGSTAACTSSAGTSAATTWCAVNDSTAAPAPAAAPTTSVTPSSGGNVPRAAACSRSRITRGVLARQAAAR